MYIPAAEMGDYEEARTRNKSGALFPLDEEGTYGRPPAQQPRAPPLPAPLPGYTKRERKPKAYASYAVSNDCCMHAQKLEKNETSATTRSRRETPPRGRTPPSSTTPAGGRSNEPPTKSATGPARSKTRPRDVQQPPRRRKPSVTERSEPVNTNGGNKTKWQNTLRETTYTARPGRWQDSLRGRDSISPSTPRIQRRASMRVRGPGRRSSTSVSPNRSRTISTSPDRRKQSVSPDRGRGRLASLDGGRGDRSSTSTDWGYTDFSTFTANRKSMDHSSMSTGRKSSSDRKSSAQFAANAERRESSAKGRKDVTSSSSSAASRRESTLTGRRESNSLASDSYGSATSTHRRTSSRDFSRSSTDRSSAGGGGGGSDSSTKFSLAALKNASINEWDDMGILGLSSKMFKESTQQKEGYMSVSASSSSYIRRESVTTKMM